MAGATDSISPSAAALFSPVLDGALGLADGARVLYMNGRKCADSLEALRGSCVDVVQPFYPYACGVSEASWSLVSAEETPDNAPYDAVFILWPKNVVEGSYLLARARLSVRKGGLIALAAGNKEGGSRLKKLLERWGALDVESVSASKCRCVWACDFAREAGDCDVVAAALQAGGVQAVLDGAFQSQAGVYGWDKVDKGSALLAEYLPDRIRGRRGADFGCGYGFLSKLVLDRLDPPYKFYIIDADKRAVDVCADNVASVQPSGGIVVPVWGDLVQGISDGEALGGAVNLDFIVMNPPFHEGKKADTSIGRAFIARAASALRDKGRLWMVANNHLPYERDLRAAFSAVDTLYEGQGFKVFEAVK